MKREFASFYGENEQDGYRIGDQAAQVAGAALAARTDAPTLQAIADMLTLLERVGGQFYVTAVRIKSELDPDWHISGLTFDYETRDAKVQTLEPPDEVRGLPVTDSSAAPTQIESPGIPVEVSPEEPEDEPDPDAEPVPGEEPEQYPVEV
jgi:hypothetical protein